MLLDGGKDDDVQIGDNGFVTALATISLAGDIAVVGVGGSVTLEGATADDSLIGGEG